MLSNLHMHSPRRFLGMVCRVALIGAYAVTWQTVAMAETPPPAMVLVPAGHFTMGSDADEGSLNSGDAAPAHDVNLAAYYIDKTEVTNAEYKRYCDAARYPSPPNWTGGTFAANDAQLPVRWVNWWEAAAYATWAGKRLPSEAEWEKAARGTDGRTYPWGNAWDAALLVWGTNGPSSVASKPKGASPYGALDMAGNVWEWVNDWYRLYPGSSLAQTASDEPSKVIRGGSYGGWEGREYDCATYHRTITRPQCRSEWIGFRCVKTVA